MGQAIATRTVPTSLPLGRDSVTYRLSMEPVNVVVGGPRALLLQVMHPAVGAGVAQHSDYDRDPWTRLVRTLVAMTQLSLGPPETSRQISRFLKQSHAKVTGIQEDGQPYRALDVENMRWVWATLLDTLLSVADGFVRPLSAEERDRLYDEWLLVAEGCGVLRAACPPDLPAFEAYVADVVANELVVTTTARNVARMLARPPFPAPLRHLASSILQVVVPGQLPPDLRDALTPGWDGGRQRSFDRLASSVRLVHRITPGRLRRLPGAVGLRVVLGSKPLHVRHDPPGVPSP